MASSKREFFPNPGLHYPISGLNSLSLGGTYIHSNWLYFENTIQKKSGGEDVLKKAVENVSRGILKIVKKEIDFYKSVEKNFLKEVNLNRETNFTRKTLLNEFNAQYKAHLNDPTTEIGELESFKIRALAGGRWPKKGTFSMKDQAAFTGAGRSREELENDILQVISFIFAIINRHRFFENLNSYAVKKSKKHYKIPELKVGDASFRKKIIKRVERVLRLIENANKERRKSGENIAETGVELRHLNMLMEVVEDISAHSYLGRVAEALTPGFINDYMQFFNIKGEKAKLQSDAYKTYNVVDTQIATIKINNIKAMVGLSQKYTKNPEFSRTYKVDKESGVSLLDIENAFNSLGLGISAGIKGDLAFLKYIKNNLTALNEWGLGDSQSIIDLDEFIGYEVTLSFLANFLRFFNGASVLLKNGDFSPIVGGDPIIFNVFLMTRHGIFYITDLIDSLFNVIKNFDSLVFGKLDDKGRRTFNKVVGFRAHAFLTDPPKLGSVDLWNKKKKAMRDIPTRDLSYNVLTKNLGGILEEISQKNKFLVEKFDFYMNPPALVKRKTRK